MGPVPALNTQALAHSRGRLMLVCRWRRRLKRNLNISVGNCRATADEFDVLQPHRDRLLADTNRDTLSRQDLRRRRHNDGLLTVEVGAALEANDPHQVAGHRRLVAAARRSAGRSGRRRVGAAGRRGVVAVGRGGCRRGCLKTRLQRRRCLRLGGRNSGDDLVELREGLDKICLPQIPLQRFRGELAPLLGRGRRLHGPGGWCVLAHEGEQALEHRGQGPRWLPTLWVVVRHRETEPGIRLEAAVGRHHEYGRGAERVVLGKSQSAPKPSSLVRGASWTL
mmetsp:Transcript_84559/g.273356  ORF Transcript_84559/g.273356 Transcript_84559/m.273356 type:complete len:280 (+) Transcript_84559:90-929(+)